MGHLSVFFNLSINKCLKIGPVPNMSECSRTSDDHLKTYVEECKGESGAVLEKWVDEGKQAYLEEWRAEGVLELEKWIAAAKAAEEDDRDPTQEELLRWWNGWKDKKYYGMTVKERQEITDNYAKYQRWKWYQFKKEAAAADERSTEKCRAEGIRYYKRTCVLTTNMYNRIRAAAEWQAEKEFPCHWNHPKNRHIPITFQERETVDLSALEEAIQT